MKRWRAAAALLFLTAADSTRAADAEIRARFIGNLAPLPRPGDQLIFHKE